jgi:FkbM family methyltransferase
MAVEIASRAIAVLLRAIASIGGDRWGAAVAERLARALPRALDRQPLRIARRCGLVFELDLRDNLQRTLYYTGSYTPRLLALLLAQLRAEDVCVDVGANIGVYALPMARRLQRLGGGHVYAFEPAPDTAAVLDRERERNEIGNLTVVPLALGSRSAVLTLKTSTQFSPHDVGVRSLFGDGVALFQTEVVTFDSWVRSRDIRRLDVIKVDVEGGEYDVLLGMREAVARLRPRCLVVEVAPDNLANAGRTLDDLIALVAELGYAPAGPSMREVAAGKWSGLGPNVLLKARAS